MNFKPLVITSILFCSSSIAAMAQDASAPTPGNLVESFQSWRVECNNLAIPAKPAAKDDQKKADDKKEEAAQPEFRQICSAFQVYNNNKSGNEIVRFIFSYTGEKGKDRKLIAGIRTLVDISFDNQPKVLVDEKDLVEGKFVRCSGNYCFTRFDLDNKKIDSLKTAKAAAFQYPLSSGRNIRIKMSTAGLEQALASLKAKDAN